MMPLQLSLAVGAVVTVAEQTPEISGKVAKVGVGAETSEAVPIVTVVVSVQFLASVTITESVPPVKLARSSVVSPLDQAKLNSAVPPDTFRSMLPSAEPTQDTLVFVAESEVLHGRATVI